MKRTTKPKRKRKPQQPNFELLREVKRAILKYPRQFYMGNWFSLRDQVGSNAGGCGTSACIAGWAIHLMGKHERLDETSKDYNYDEAEARGRKILRLSFAQGNRLLFTSGWPQRYEKQLSGAQTTEAAAKVAARRIKWFIKTNGEQ